jgi:sporulation protein YlmC with PRC-barrel domain
MSVLQQVKIVSQLLDLQIIDKDERSCGVVDDVELSGEPRKPLRVAALLVGPGAYERRMPAWLYWLVTKVAGDRMARVPANEILEIGSVVKLKSRAEKFGLHVVEDKVAEWIPRKGAL